MLNIKLKAKGMNPIELAKSGNEHGEQRAFFAWCNMAYLYGIKAANDMDSYTKPKHAATKYAAEPKLIQLKWIHAIHNQGHGDAVRGGKAKAEGVKAGVLDIFLPWPMFNDDRLMLRAHGLYIEFKVGKNVPTNEQEDFAQDMDNLNYECRLAYSWQQGVKVVCDYLGLAA